MEPPSYEEASLQPPVLSNIPPPPSYSASHSSPSTPPPTYGEAVTIPPNLFPVLTPPPLPVAATSPQNTGVIVHPVTQIGVTPTVNSRQTPSAVVVTQPSPVPISVTCLTNIPGLVRCPYCHQTVITTVRHMPGGYAWGLCIFLSLIGLICGFCLIPLMIRGLQDAHHTCPQCGTLLHVYKE